MKNWTDGKIVNVIGEIVMEYRDFFIKSLMSNPGLDNTAFLSFREKWNSHKNDSGIYSWCS